MSSDFQTISMDLLAPPFINTHPGSVYLDRCRNYNMVIGADGEGKKLISGVVILDPVRFVNPLPPNNPCIVRFDKPIEHV